MLMLASVTAPTLPARRGARRLAGWPAASAGAVAGEVGGRASGGLPGGFGGQGDRASGAGAPRQAIGGGEADDDVVLVPVVGVGGVIAAGGHYGRRLVDVDVGLGDGADVAGQAGGAAAGGLAGGLGGRGRRRGRWTCLWRTARRLRRTG